MDVEIREIACEGAQASVERVERALHLRKQKTQHQSGEGDKNRDNQSDMVNRFACSMPLSQSPMQIHAQACGAEQENENDQDKEAAVRHSLRFEVCTNAEPARRFGWSELVIVGHPRTIAKA
jgi:hypothetical protein